MHLLFISLSDEPEKIEYRRKTLEYLQTRQLKNVAQLQGKDAVILMARVPSDAVSSVMKGLEKIGVGVQFGIIDMLELQASKPLDDSKRKKKFFGTSLPKEVLQKTVGAGAEMNFDTLTLLVTAAVLASVGLIDNSSVIIVASMLVSPMMGPILGAVFGTLIYDKALVIQSLMSEIIGTIVVWCTGALIGVLSSFIFTGCDDWPHEEMANRGHWRSLLFGLFIAIPSGFGVALSVAGNQINSFVGVAISAAVLPPVANSGLNFAYGIIAPSLMDFSEEHCKAYDKPHDKRVYHMVIAAYSIALYLLNFLCIYATGLIFLKLKQISPTKKKNQKFEDLPAYFPLDLRKGASVLNRV